MGIEAPRHRLGSRSKHAPRPEAVIAETAWKKGIDYEPPIAPRARNENATVLIADDFERRARDGRRPTFAERAVNRAV